MPNIGQFIFCMIIVISIGAVIVVLSNKGKNGRVNNKPSRGTVIIYGACAVIWTIRAILEINYKTYNDSVFMFVLNVSCFPIWIGASVMAFNRYRENE